MIYTKTRLQYKENHIDLASNFSSPLMSQPKARKSTSIITKLLFAAFLLACLGAVGVIGIFAYYSKGLPSTEELKNYYPKTTTRLYDANGGLLAEFATEKRVFVPITSIPDVVKQAFVAAEDQNFYKHSGVDVFSIFRAVIHNAVAKLTHHGGLSGGSTITQQVVKNLLLNKDKTIARKVKEAILAVRVTQAMPKDKILEIYLNEIFLGNRSYGVVAASYNYFNKSIDELTVEEAAFLAAMPKAPSNFDPRKNYERALERRNYVLERMYQDDYITKKDAEIAKAKPINLAKGVEKEIATNNFAEEIRRFMIEKYGEEQVYGGGMTVRTTLDPKLQRYAEKALYDGITAYDRRHGWRGPLPTRIDNLELWHESLLAAKAPEAIGPWKMAAVLSTTDKTAELGLKDGSTATLTFDGLKWAKKWYSGQRYGEDPHSVKDVIKPGDVIMVDNEKDDKGNTRLTLEQIPDVNGAMMVMNPSSGRVLAMVGGYPYGNSDFNRATQAKRQPGSSFKPFVYMTALENGFLPSTIVNDGPIEVPQGPGLPMWTPKNYGGDFLGRIPLRVALAKSRNNVTVLVSLMMGVSKVQEMATRMGILDKPAPYYSMVLGADETTLMRLITAYATVDNYGKQVKPILIDRIQDRTGKTIYVGEREENSRECVGCSGENISTTAPEIIDKSKQLVDPATTYQLITMLEGVIQFGTSTRAKVLGRPLAGKTGTTNESFDTWFMGFTPDIVVGTFIGFDHPKTLGRDATGASVPLPAFIDFMQQAMKDVPPKPFPIPPGVRFQRIDVTTGHAPTDQSSPANIQMEVINPRAPEDIQYSDEYREKFMNGEGVIGGGNSGYGGSSSGNVDSGLY